LDGVDQVLGGARHRRRLAKVACGSASEFVARSGPSDLLRGRADARVQVVMGGDNGSDGHAAQRTIHRTTNTAQHSSTQRITTKQDKTTNTHSHTKNAKQNIHSNL
jgi:hypothetical protein